MLEWQLAGPRLSSLERASVCGYTFPVIKLLPTVRNIVLSFHLGILVLVVALPCELLRVNFLIGVALSLDLSEA